MLVLMPVSLPHPGSCLCLCPHCSLHLEQPLPKDLSPISDLTQMSPTPRSLSWPTFHEDRIKLTCSVSLCHLLPSTLCGSHLYTWAETLPQCCHRVFRMWALLTITAQCMYKIEVKFYLRTGQGCPWLSGSFSFPIQRSLRKRDRSIVYWLAES